MLALGLFLPLVTSAGPAAAGASLEVEAGYAGTYIPGQPVPVRVRVSADQLLSTELHVSVSNAPMAVPIEVPGGSTKEFLVVVPTSTARIGPAEVTARLRGGASAAATSSIAPLGDQEVVGLLPGALAGRALPGPAPLAVDVGVARFVALGPLELEQAPASLMALGTIGMGADELVRQAPSVRTALLRWVETGGRLLVDAAPGSTVVALPDGWQPGASGRARPGAGEIRLTDGRMAAGQWSGLVEPTRRTTGSGPRAAGGPPLGDMLAGEAGFAVARLSWLMAFLVLYVAVVGPVLYLILRRRHRQEMGWVAIPLVAILFTGASYGGGRSLRNATPAVHGTLVFTGSQGSTAETYLGVSSRSGATARLSYPDGWLTGAGDETSARPTDRAPVRRTASGIDARLPLDAGQFAVMAARGPVDVKGSLEVVASSDGDGSVRGTIRNGTSMTLESVGVLTANTATRVGALRPGEQREWTLQSLGARGGPPPEFTLWQPDGPANRQALTNLSLWAAAQRPDLLTRENGQVIAVGWTREWSPPVKVGGHRDRLTGQTLVLGTGSVSAAGGRATDMSVQAQFVRTSASGGGSVVRLVLPSVDHTIDPAKLVLRMPTPRGEVWDGEGWKALECSTPGCRPPTATVTRACPPGATCPEGVLVAPAPGTGPGGPFAQVNGLPSGAIRDGVVYLRFPSGLPPSPVSDFTLSLRESA